MNGLSLAYLGDAYYELKIRQHLINLGYQNADILHKEAINYVSAVAQSYLLDTLIKNAVITPDEITIFKRARNAITQSRKNVDAKTYGQATGFEAIIGHLYLTDLNRCDTIINKCINYIAERIQDGKEN